MNPFSLHLSLSLSVDPVSFPCFYSYSSIAVYPLSCFLSYPLLTVCPSAPYSVLAPSLPSYHPTLHLLIYLLPTPSRILPPPFLPSLRLPVPPSLHFLLSFLPLLPSHSTTFPSHTASLRSQTTYYNVVKGVGESEYTSLD